MLIFHIIVLKYFFPNYLKSKSFSSLPKASGEESEPAKYDFVWHSKDYSGNDFGHHDSRDGDNTEGSYFVLLPDGRLQTVTYYVDGDSGFVAEVKYEGVAHYAEVVTTRDQSDESEVSETSRSSGYSQRDSGFSVAAPQHAQGSTESRKGYSYTPPKTPFVHYLGPFPSVGTKYSRVGADDSSESRETANMSSMKPTYSRFGTESADESTELSRFSATGQTSSRGGTDASVASMEASYYPGPRYYDDFDSSPEKTGRSSIADESQAMSHFSFARSNSPNRGFDDSLEVSTPIMKHPHPMNSHELGESNKRIYIPPRKTSYTYHTPRSFHPPTNSQKRPHFPFQTMRFEASKPSHSEPESRDASTGTRYSSVSLEDSREEEESNYAPRTHFALSMEDSDESLDESHESEYGYEYESPSVPFSLPL